MHRPFTLLLFWGAVGLIGGHLRANAPKYDVQQVQREHAAIAAAFQSTDILALRRLLRESSLYTQPAAAMALARLSVTEALPEIKKLDEQYANYPCVKAGEFRVAVILLVKRNREEQKKRLLEVATADPQKREFPSSVIDRAARELAAYGGDDLVQALGPIQTYGAQYTVLYLKTRSLNPPQIVELCLEKLAAHETPQQAEAAQKVLTALGSQAVAPVRLLREKMERRVQETGPRSIAQTVVNRCDRILEAFKQAAAPENDH